MTIAMNKLKATQLIYKHKATNIPNSCSVGRGRRARGDDGGVVVVVVVVVDGIAV